MARIVAISPVPGDAVFACGGTLHKHAAGAHEVVLVTVFSGGPEDELAEIRRGEDELAVAQLGLAGPIHLALAEADDDAQRVARTILTIALEQLAPDLVLAPAAIGEEAEAIVVDGALTELGTARLRWLDQPASQRPGARMPEGERVAVPLGPDDVEAKLAAVGAYASRLQALFGSPSAMRAQLGGEAEFFVR